MSSIARTTSGRLALLAGAGIGTALVLGAVLVSGAGADASGPALYQRTLNGSDVVLGPQSSPTTVLTTGVLPVGRYHVQTNVGLVLGRNVNVVCTIATTAGSDTVTGDYGAAGNGSSTSGNGAGGIYGVASMNHTVRIASSGDHLQVVCNAGAPGTGTYVGGVSLTAQPLGSIRPF